MPAKPRPTACHAIRARDPQPDAPGRRRPSTLFPFASLAFAVLFAVPRRYVWSAIASGAIGYVATAVGTRVLPGHIAAFLAALAVCSSSNVFARVTGRPAQLFQLPGLTLLVPGSFGFLSLESFLSGDYLKGAAQGFQMFLVAAALVSGILLSSVVVPPRKLL